MKRRITTPAVVAVVAVAAFAVVTAVLLTSGGGHKTLTLTPKATATAAPGASSSPLPCGGPCTPPSPGRHTITYIVTGSAATVTYGPAGSTFAASVPLHVTRTLKHPSYYAISAQLENPGRVTCKIEVDGKTIATDAAAGSYSIARCQISPDPFTGAWADTNANS